MGEPGVPRAREQLALSSRSDASRGAIAGAAGGATAGLIRGMFDRNDPAPVYRAYVNRCLAEQGYESIGWD